MSVSQDLSPEPSKSKKFWPAVALFFVAPYVAEFLLGDLSIVVLPIILVLSLLYGAGALLIRETTRRTGRGWPTIMLLGVAYAIYEEAFTTQSLFNPNYLQKSLHLLDHAYIPALGIGAWWTLFMLNVHAVWSIATSICLVEACVPDRAKTPWLKTPGLIVTIVLFGLGTLVLTRFQLTRDPFRASSAQLLTSAAICVLLVVVAFTIPKSFPRKSLGPQLGHPVLIGLGLLLGSACLLIPTSLGWGAFGLMLGLDVLAILLISRLSMSPSWGIEENFSLAVGAAFAYGWHSFIQPPVLGPLLATRIGNVIFVGILIGIVLFASKRLRAFPTSKPVGPR